MKINLHSPIEEVQIQIIPLLDVIFCILTFFLLAALQFTRQQAINVDLPKASTGAPTRFQSRLIVTLDSAGQVFVEKNPVALDQLSDTLRTYFQANPLGTVILNASRTSSYNDVVQLLDVMRQVGGDRVALATIAGSLDRPAGSTLSPATIPTTPYTSIPGQSLNQPSNPTFPTAPAPQPTVSPGSINTSPQN